MTKTLTLATALVVGTLLLAACGGGERGAVSDDAAAGNGSGTASGIPVREPTGPVDPQLAARGERLFRTTGCVSCHTMGEGRRVGPDLAGVTRRRSFAWTYHMVVNPDSMVRNDSIAKALLSEYFTPMPDQNVQPDQFRALYEYLRSESGAPGGPS